MADKKYTDNEKELNIVNDYQEAYESLDRKRRTEAILSSDTEKFKLFTKLMRISRMLKNAKVTHKTNE